MLRALRWSGTDHNQPTAAATETLPQRTCQPTNPSLQVIVEKMVEYLRGVTDDVAKADVVQRIGDLAERYAPDTQWFIDTMNQVVYAPTSSCCCCVKDPNAALIVC